MLAQKISLDQNLVQNWLINDPKMAKIELNSKSALFWSFWGHFFDKFWPRPIIFWEIKSILVISNPNNSLAKPELKNLKESLWTQNRLCFGHFGAIFLAKVWPRPIFFCEIISTWVISNPKKQFGRVRIKNLKKSFELNFDSILAIFWIFFGQVLKKISNPKILGKRLIHFNHHLTTF